MNRQNLSKQIFLEHTPECIHVQFDTPHLVVSSAALNGGFVEASHILNLNVKECSEAAGKALNPPEVTLSDYCVGCNWSGNTVGMMTAASMESFRMVQAIEQGVGIFVLVTAGLSNARRAGDHAEHRDIVTPAVDAGTINIICLTSAGLTPAAMIESIMTGTEAKVAALQNLDIKSPVSNNLATGTGTDSIAIASDPASTELRYCGKHVIFGEKLANLIIEAVTSSLKWNLGRHT